MDTPKRETIRRVLDDIGLILIELAYVFFVVCLVWWIIPLAISKGVKETPLDFSHPNIMTGATIALALGLIWPAIAPVVISPVAQLFHPKNRDAAEVFVDRHEVPRRGPYVIIIGALLVMFVISTFT